MDFQEIKDIIQSDGGKVIIVENGKPQLVVMSFEEYKRKSGQGRPAPSFTQPASPRGEPVQRIEEREREELTIDDLPLS